MDFAKTTICQRTRSCYDKFYLEYNEKKRNVTPRTGGGDDGLISDSGGDRIETRVAGDTSKGRNSRKLSEGLQGRDGDRNAIDTVARRTRQGLRRKELGEFKESDKNLSRVGLTDEPENDGDGLQNHVCLIEDDSGSEKTEEITHEGLRGRDGGRNAVDAVARRTRQGLRRKELGKFKESDKNLSTVGLTDEPENDGDGLQNHVCLIEDDSGSEKTEEITHEGLRGRDGGRNAVLAVARRTRQGLRRMESGDFTKSGKNLSRVGLIDESEKDDDGLKDHVCLIEDDSESEKTNEKLREGLQGRDVRRNAVDAVARRTRQGLRRRMESGIFSNSDKNLNRDGLIGESENDDDGLKNNICLIADDSGSEETDNLLQRDQSGKQGKNVSRSTLIDDDFEQNNDGDDMEMDKSNEENESKLNVKGISGKGTVDHKSSRTKDCSLSSGGFPLLQSDDDEGVVFLGDDATCLDDYDPSHSSRVESNEVKLSPVELDSIQADADDVAKLQGLKSSEEEEDDPRKLLSPEEDAPIENNAAAGGNDVITLSSSSDSDNGDKDGNVMDDDDKEDDLDHRFWAELVRKSILVEEHEVHDDFELHTYKPKPVGESVKKNNKANKLEPAVGKKRCGNSNETLKPIEGQSKKRRSDDNNRGGDGMFWQIVDEKGVQNAGKSISKKYDQKGVQNAGKSISKKYDQFGNKINVMKILTDAIREEGDEDTLLKTYLDDPLEEDPVEEDACHVHQIQLYKFKFEDEVNIKPEKSESELEVDELFNEMNMYLQSSEIGADTHGVNRTYTDFLVAETDQATRCRQGKHQLTINDEFGIVCRYCSYVEMEIRDILPPLSKNGRGGGHGRHDRERTKMTLSDLKLTDCNPEDHLDSEGCEYEKGTVWDLVPGVKESMYPHQRDGFEFIWDKIAGGTYIDKLEKQLPTGGSGCIISHAPGTGKSRLTIVFLQAFLKMYPSSRPLIIAPRSMLLTWEEEFKKWNVDFPFFNLNNTEVSGQEYKPGTIFLKQSGSIKSPLQIRLLKLLSWKKTRSVLGITYRLFESLAGEERKRKRNNVDGDQIKSILLQVPTLLVLDEGHTPRNDQSLMWKALLKVKTKRCIILSGTPFQNNFDELYNTLCLVNPLLSFGISSQNSLQFSKKRGWKNIEAKGQWDSITSSITNSVWKSQNKLQELKDLIDPFVHVHKGTILQERLLGLRDALVVLKPTKTQKTLLARMHGRKLTLENDCLMSLVSVHPSLLPSGSDNERFRKVLKMFESDPSAGVKTHFLMELLKLSGAHGEKVLVFSQYIKPLEFILQLLKTNFRWVEGRDCLYMDGQQEEKHRQNSINTLNDPKSEVKVLLASIRACSEGINLVGASRVVLLDVHWNPSVERQAISRAYRLGQTKLVHVYHLVTGSMEGEKYIRQVEKSHLSELVFASRNKDSSNPTISTTVLKDKILEEMVQHDKLQHMFEKVIYQPKEADLIATFG